MSGLPTARARLPQRLCRPAEFAAVRAAPRGRAFRASRHWLAMAAAWSAGDRARLRFGVVVGRRQARRAVDRAVVKRIVRESIRAAAPSIERAAAAATLRVDVVFRLKAARVPGDPAQRLVPWKRVLREEADALCKDLERRLLDWSSE